MSAPLDAVRAGLTHIHNTIPPQILAAAFQPYNHPEIGNVDELIKQKVFIHSMRDELSVRGGKPIHFVVQQNWAKITQSPSPYALGIAGSYSVFQIPPQARDFRDISCVEDVAYPYTLGSNTNSCTFYNNCSSNGNTLSTLVTAALQSQTGEGNLTVPTGIVRPNNIIQLDPPQYNFVPWKITCRLRFDDNFSGMDINSIETFKKLCEYAVKRYCYVNLIFEVETNMVQRGMELGVMKEIINSYADADEKYQEQLVAFGGAQVIDPDRLPAILRLMVPRA